MVLCLLTKLLNSPILPINFLDDPIYHSIEDKGTGGFLVVKESII